MHGTHSRKWLVAALLTTLCVVAPPPAAAQGGTRLEDALTAVHGLCDWDEAMALLAALDGDYRVRGNQAYHRSLERVFLNLAEAGFAEEGGARADQDTLEFRDLGATQPAWTPSHAALFVHSPDEIELLAFDDMDDRDRTFVCPNSFPTPEQGLVAPLVRYEHGRPVETYAGTVVDGALPVGDLFARAVQAGGALGVISSYLGEYNRPDDHPEAIRFKAIPYDAERRGFGLNVSRTKARLLESLLRGGVVYVRVVIGSSFTPARARTLVARIAGSDPDAGAVVISTTADEPGANDNGSGMVATTAMAAGYLRGIRDGRIARPAREIVFLFGPELEASGEWLATRPGPVGLALVMDMVGQDPDKTGAIALVERMPDPGAIWDRPPLDIHSEWGRGDVRESDLSGSFLNDYVMAAMNLRAAETDWVVRSNPYEGGSDQGRFLERGIPSVLLWHFTDAFYDTNLDRLDKVSRTELENTTTAALALVHHYVQAGAGRASEVLDIVMAAARKRLSIEANTARGFLSAPAVAQDQAQRDAVLDRERHILQAWGRWYRQAVLTIEGFDPGLPFGERTELQGRIDGALIELREIERETLESLAEVPVGG